jgi:NAD(P)-dependent dehydrogenase (short-subunit alcohol dehydrogenase family)
VLVTGGAHGIGLDTARRAAAAGARVALVDRDGEAAEREAAALGDRAAGLHADVTDHDGLAAAVEATVARFGGLDVAVANAGIASPPGTVLSVGEDDWLRVVDVNLEGVYRTVKLALPHVVARRGHLVLVASVYAFANGAMASPYAAAKAGVEALGRALRVELAPHGVTVGLAYFGFIDTRLVRDAFADPHMAELRESLPGFVRRPLPVGRAGAALVRGIERRSERVMVPRYVPAMAALRGLLPFTLDRALGRDERLRRTLAAVEARGDTKLTPASPSR